MKSVCRLIAIVQVAFASSESWVACDSKKSLSLLPVFWDDVVGVDRRASDAGEELQDCEEEKEHLFYFGDKIFCEWKE